MLTIKYTNKMKSDAKLMRKRGKDMDILKLIQFAFIASEPSLMGTSQSHS